MSYNIKKIRGDSLNSEIISHYHDDKIFYNHVKMCNSVFDMHTHDISEIIFLKHGNVSGIIGGKTYKLHKESIIIFRPNIPHRIVLNDESVYERYNILFDEKVLANKMFENIPDDIDVINYNGNNYIGDLFRKFDYYCKNFSGENIKLLVTHLIEELILNMTLVAKENSGAELLSVNPVINHAVEYIDNHYTENITIDDITNNLYITKSYLHQLFNENLLISPKKYINSKRLEKARNLLRSGLKPNEIYLSCGFTDYATFYRNYKGYFGHSPSEETSTVIERKIES